MVWYHNGDGGGLFNGRYGFRGRLGRVVWELVFSILYCMIGLDFLISVLWIKGVLGKRYYWYCALANRVASMISAALC